MAARRYFKSIYSFLLFLLIGLVAILSTYGWRLSSVGYSVHMEKDQLIKENLKNHVVFLSETVGSRNIQEYENLKRAAQYIVDHFKGLELDVRVQIFEVDGQKVGNIIAEKKGARHPDSVIIFGANYDTYHNPGADTNASGVAAVLELARLFAKEQTDQTLRFVAFVNKESPYFQTGNMGSTRYVRELKEEKQNVGMVFIFDSIGFFTTKNFSQRYPPFLGIFFPDKGQFISLISSLKSRRSARAITQILRRETSFPIYTIFGYDFVDSDHTNFWQEDYPAILITDTGSYRNPDYHSLSDTPDKLDYLKMAQLIRGLKVAVKDTMMSLSIQEE
ncbi:MAG: M28 family peptidase [Candidatus Omnitrophota bacterium]